MTNFISPEEEFNYPNKPGYYSKLSVVVGSRSSELKKIHDYKDIFSVYQKELYSKQNLLIPIKLKDKVDKYSKKIFEDYISRHKQENLTVYNAVDWMINSSLGSFTFYPDKVWCAYAFVGHPDLNPYRINDNYLPSYIAAFHEFMHVEEIVKECSMKNRLEYNPIVEVLTCTKSIILIDEVYKYALDIPLEDEVDYGVTFKFFNKEISQGALANFYRTCEKKYSSLADALISKESLSFIGYNPNQGFFNQKRDSVSSLLTSSENINNTFF